jgi:hypothetical protein
MRSYTIILYVERGEDELELEVSGTVSAYVPAVTHRLPENCSPAEGGEVEITSIKLNNETWDGELTDDEREKAEEKLFDAMNDDDEDEPPISDDFDYDFPKSYERDDFC